MMKCKKSLLTLLTVGSAICSATLSHAQEDPAKPEEAPQKNPAHGQPGHVHDERCGHDHAIEQKKRTVEQVRAFLKKHAGYILPEFEKVMKGKDEEHIDWMLKDISKIMSEHADLEAFDPKLAALFIEVFKLENDFYAFIETKLEAGVKPEEAGVAAKPHLKVLIAKRIQLDQGQIAYQKAQLDKEFKELEAAAKKLDEITEKELKQIVSELKAQKSTNPEPEKKPAR